MPAIQRVKVVGIFFAGLVVGGGLVAALAAVPGTEKRSAAEPLDMCAVGHEGYLVTSSGGKLTVWRYFADSLIRIQSYDIATGEPVEDG